VGALWKGKGTKYCCHSCKRDTRCTVCFFIIYLVTVDLSEMCYKFGEVILTVYNDKNFLVCIPIEQNENYVKSPPEKKIVIMF
jgi:hypothetical protein